MAPAGAFSGILATGLDPWVRVGPLVGRLLGFQPRRWIPIKVVDSYMYTPRLEELRPRFRLVRPYLEYMYMFMYMWL